MSESNCTARGGATQLPEAPQAERGVIGALLVDPSVWAKVAAIIAPADFIGIAARTVFSAIDRMVTDGVPVDLFTLVERLRERGDLEKAGGMAAMARMVNETPSAAHAVYYAEQVREASQKRRLAFAAAELGRMALNGKTATEVLDFARGELTEIEQRQQPPKPRFELLTAAELAGTSTDVPYIVPGVLAEAQPALVVGGSKTMKTSCLIDLAISVATGGYFLGYFHVPQPQRVLMLSGESGRATIAETATRIAAAAHVDLAQVDGLLFGDSLPRLADAADVRELGRVLKGEAVKLLIIDPVYLAMNLEGRESSLFAVGAQLGQISEVCQAHGCTLILAHHAKQGVARDNEPPQLGDASWAGFEQFARQWIVIKRRARYMPGSGEHPLWMATGGSAGHGGLYAVDIEEGTRESPGGRFWSVSVETALAAMETAQQAQQLAQQQQHAAKVEQDAAQIVTLLGQYPNGETRSVLRDLAGMNGKRLAPAILHLLATGTMTTCTITKGSRTYEAFRLVNP